MFHMFVSTTQYVYNSPPTHSIEEPTIHQLNSTDIVITTPGALGRWSQTDQFFADSDQNSLLATDLLISLN